MPEGEEALAQALGVQVALGEEAMALQQEEAQGSTAQVEVAGHSVLAELVSVLQAAPAS
jgi:hypothetical protein